MPDLAAELRQAIEHAAFQQLEGTAAQRGWDLGAATTIGLLASGGAAIEADSAIVFATGYDGTLTTVGFTFGISLFGGPDMLL